MPVPVPPRSQPPPAHPVLKPPRGADISPSVPYKPSLFQHLTQDLPLPPQRPPPSFGTRDEWISSLPSWRRNKPRRIWEDDIAALNQDSSYGSQPMLMANAGATWIEETRPPCLRSDYMFIPASSGNSLTIANVDDDMDCGAQSGWRRGGDAPTRVEGCESMECDTAYERGAFTPVFEDLSPDLVGGPDPTSSPIGPATPFGEYVDRAVAATQGLATYECNKSFESTERYALSFQDHHACIPQFEQHHHVEQPLHMTEAAATVMTPSATDAYRKLAEPLSEWVAGYVWKVCTTGFSLPPVAPPLRHESAVRKVCSSVPPSTLAGLIRSLLLSTLLQPSAIFLAVWYIVQLPVSYEPVCFDAEHIKENRFRDELFGGAEQDEFQEAHTPFRLVLLGCMLANKWLDDHTFSNQTWHTISNVPIRSLNRLESLALDLLSHDLSISPRTWSQWLDHIRAYHGSLSLPASYPQPISRPSANPHSIVRKAIEELIQAPMVSTGDINHDFSESSDDRAEAKPPEPVFLGLEERRREKMLREIKMEEIDLDQDGPLREEYLPRRRGIISAHPRVSDGDTQGRLDYRDEHAGLWRGRAALPPPARWSPNADEPITRQRDGFIRQYMAVQPVRPPPPYPVTPYQMLHGPGSEQGQCVHPAGPPPARVWYGADEHSNYSSTHARSHSLSWEHGRPDVPARPRSNTKVDYLCSAMRMTAEVATPPLIPPFPCLIPLRRPCPLNEYTRFYLPSATNANPHVFQPTWLRA